ncbi:MAG: hypothetical protein ACI85E_000211 [Marinomonas primoryensis]|jgi:hypothetical protein
MSVYSIKIALRGISPMIWRRHQLSGGTSLAELHHIIQLSMGWDDEYLHYFHIFGKDYGIAYVGGLSFADNSHDVTLDNFGFDIGDRFTYAYNFFDYWLSDIRIEGLQTNTNNETPFCTGGQGRLVDNKPCYRGDEVLALVDVLDTIFHGDDTTTTVGDVRALIETYEDTRFNRSAINARLAHPLTEAA